MAEPQFDELNTATRKNIMPSLADNFFKNGPVMRFVKEKRMKLFRGGTGIQENFVYKPMRGGSYKKGKTFDITKRQTKTGMFFDIRKYYVNVTEFVEDIEIELNSQEAVFDTVRTDLGNAALTLSAILEIAIWQHGQNVASGDRSGELNGFEEALNDGTNASWAGNLFPAYGGQARVDVTPALNPAAGTAIPSPNIAGPITNHVLEHTFQSCVLGEERPKLGVTTTKSMAFINENYQPQQRLVDTVEPTIGWPGLKFKTAVIIESQYMPGGDGVNDPDIGNYLTSDGYETFAWLNPGGEGDDAYFRLHVSSSPKFQFGFTGFKVAQDSTQVAGQILFGGNFTVRTPRLMRMFHGIQS